MTNIISKRTYQAMYRLLNRVSPINGDCGTFCGSICCTYDEQQNANEGYLDEVDEMVIYLYPGEEELFNMNEDWLQWTIENAEDYEFPNSWTGKVYSVRCTTPPLCQRNMRPLQCRFYPLASHFDDEGQLRLILADIPDMPYECPIIRDEMPLNYDFVKATYTVWKHLIRDPRIKDLVQMDSDMRREMNLELRYIIKQDYQFQDS